MGQFALASARLLGAGRLIAIDSEPERLEMARANSGAETIDFSKEDVLKRIDEMTNGIGLMHALMRWAWNLTA